MIIAGFCQVSGGTPQQMDFVNNTIVLGTPSISSGIDLSYNGTSTVDSQTGNQTINGTPAQYQSDSTTASFSINMIGGLLALIIGLTAVAVVAGIRVLGSGLSEKSVTIIYNSTVYYGLWGIFSALSIVLFSALPLFGMLLWLGLTLCYSIGYFETTWRTN
jgi:hypothetical protein